MKLKIKNSFIPWSFLDIVAKEDAIFAKNGLDVEFFTHNRDEREPEDKILWYSDLVKGGKLDVYSVSPFGAVDRLASSGQEKILGASTSTGQAFSIVADTRSGIREIKDLANVPVAVNLRTGSHFCTIKKLEDYIPYENIKVVHGGEPPRRLRGLIAQRFKAVTLISPYTEVAEALGYAKLAETQTADVLVFVIRKDMPNEVMLAYLVSLDEAATRVNRDPERYRALYTRTLLQSFDDYPDELRRLMYTLVNKMSKQLPITVWSRLTEYPRQSFESLKEWMEKHDLLDEQVGYDQIVHGKPLATMLNTLRHGRSSRS